MKNIAIILCLVGMVVGGFIKDRPRLHLYNAEGRENRAGRLYTMTKDELLRQQFILDVLRQVELPLKIPDILQVEIEDITNDNMYTGPLNEDMLLVLGKIRNKEILGRNEVYSVNNEQHLRQMIGLYRLFVRCRDFEVFQRVAIYARQSINPALFVNAFVLALKYRIDTEMLIVPALYEILPKLYIEDGLITEVEYIGSSDLIHGTSSIRQNLLDLIRATKMTRLINRPLSQRENSMQIMDKSQLWMPWREIHRELALERSLSGRGSFWDRSTLQSSKKESGTSKPIGLLEDDVGLRSFINILVDELILTNSKEGDILIRDRVVNSDISSVNSILDQRRLMDDRDERDRIESNAILNKNRGSTDEKDWLNTRSMYETTVNSMLDQRRLMNDRDERSRLEDNAVFNKNRGSTEEGDRLNPRSMYESIVGRKRLIDDLPTTTINDDRLLHISQRRLNLIRSSLDANRDMPLQSNRNIRLESLQTPIGRVERQQNPDDDDILPLNNDAMNSKRYNEEGDIGQLLLNYLQELVARLNIEQISLRRINDGLNLQKNVMNDITSNQYSQRVVVDKLNEISERINQSTRQIRMHVSTRQSYYDVINGNDEMLQKQLNSMALTEILHEILSLCDFVRGGQVVNLLENPTIRLLLQHVVTTMDQQMQILQRERSIEDIAFKGVTINNLKIDKLRTFIEYTDVDMSNMQDTKVGGNGRYSKIMIGRIPRLNHKSFNINVDITSDRNQRVIVRTLLGPKTDAVGNLLSLDELRQNIVLLDIAGVELSEGRNLIKRKSIDIGWTAPDTTMYSEIYERVMGALQGDFDLTKSIVGQINLLPHRLLVPRGRIDGLPMQVLLVITPIGENNDEVKRLMGVESLFLDGLPSRYPFDRKIKDLNKLLSLSNVYLKDVAIYHDD